MDNNAITLMLSENSSTLLEQLREATPTQLLNMAASFASAEAGALEEVIQSGWIRLFFTEWQAQLVRFSHRFIFPKDSKQLLRIVRGQTASGLHCELETFQLGRLTDAGYFLNEEQGTLNIQCGFPKSAYRPYYQLSLADIKGFLIDHWGDFPTDISTVRDASAPASCIDNAEAVRLAQQNSVLLQQAFAAGCLPQSLTVDVLKTHLNELDNIAGQYRTLMDDAASMLAMAMWRIDVSVRFDDDTQVFSFFTFPADEYGDVIAIHGGLLSITSFDGIAGVFNVSDVESYTVIDALTGEEVDYVDVSVDQNEQYQ